MTEPVVVTGFDVRDVRFPTSAQLDGSDAMNPAPDYSAAYLEIRTSQGHAGYALVFTVGRGNEIQVAAVEAFREMVVGRVLTDPVTDTAELTRLLAGDSQLRWLGPGKGPVHMAAGAVVNAVWDLAARRAGLPLWRLLAQLDAQRIVDAVDFTYLRDALTEDEAHDLLGLRGEGHQSRVAELEGRGHPAYTTTPGWLGYDDDRLQRLSREAVADGFTMIKLKVGADPVADEHRMKLARDAVGPQVEIAIDANQIWGVPDAIEALDRLAAFEPYWIEEPTSPDDVLGHAAIRRAVSPIRVATGEHAANAVVVKQLLQAGAVDVVQLDACRTAGVNENIAILLLAAKFGVSVCPHAGGVGLCELVQHLAMFDFVRVGASWEGRWIEYVDHLHEHFESPVQLRGGRYLAPQRPGSGARMLEDSLRAYAYPDGPTWRARR